MAEMVTLTIDDKTVTVPAGTLVVDAAKKVGVDIPVFCYHPKMEPVGMCRMCLVEVGTPQRDRATGELVKNDDGTVKISFSPKLETACTTRVSQGMVVKTHTEKAVEGHKGILEFLLTSHPLDCPICDKGGECPLQNLTMAHGPGESRFLYDEKKHLAKHVPLGELIYLDRERCIQCARCVRFQHDVVDEPVLHFYNRGRSLEIRTYSEPGFDSIFSGNTTDICPVGALTTSDFRFGARPWEMKKGASICTHCPVGCNLTYNVRREARSNGRQVIKRTMPRQNEQVNEIWICDKGRLGYHFTESKERITQPMVRKENVLVPATWSEAYQVVEDQLRKDHKGLVSLAGGRLANEDLFNLQQLTQSQNGKPVLYSFMAGGDLTAQVGLGKGTNFSDLGKGDVVLVVASDLHEEAPIWWLRLKQAAGRGATLILAAARPTRMDKYAHHLVRYQYGEEASTIAAFLEDGKPGEELSSAVEAVKNAENLIVIYGSDGLGLNGSEHLSKACAKLLVEHKAYGKPKNGLLAVWERANTQGAWDMGFHPDRNLKNTLREAGIVFIAAADPAGDDPNLAEALQDADFIIVNELFMTETAQLADVVFPVQAQPEREGSYTSGERRAQRFGGVVTPWEGPRADYRIYAEIARQMGLALDDQSPVLVMKQIAAKVPGYQGVSYTSMAKVEEQWPMMGRKDLYYAGTSYENEDGLGVKIPSAADRNEELALGALLLTEQPAEVATGLRIVPVTAIYDRGQMLQPSSLLDKRLVSQAFRMHPDLVKKYGLKDGDKIEVTVAGHQVITWIAEDGEAPADVALVVRSNGYPISGPQYVQIQRLTEEEMV